MAIKSKAAIDNAPAGSTTIASSLYNCKMVEHTLPSGTKIILSSVFLQTANVSFPTCFTAAPSTNLSIVVNGSASFWSRANCIEGAPSGSIPSIFVNGLNFLKTVETPAANPPPPTGSNT